MKKNYVIRIAALVLMCTLVTACFASSTFARYVQTTESTAKLTVATWSITDGTTAIGKSINLTQGDLYEDGAYGTDEKNADAIAPGTCGSVSFALKNESDVNAKYSIVVTKDKDMPAGIVLYSDSAFKNPIGTDPITGDLDMDAENAETITIYWNWEFTNDDETSVAGSSFDLDLGITVEQVD